MDMASLRFRYQHHIIITPMTPKERKLMGKTKDDVDDAEKKKKSKDKKKKHSHEGHEDVKKRPKEGHSFDEDEWKTKDKKKEADLDKKKKKHRHGEEKPKKTKDSKENKKSKDRRKEKEESKRALKEDSSENDIPLNNKSNRVNRSPQQNYPSRLPLDSQGQPTKPTAAPEQPPMPQYGYPTPMGPEFPPPPFPGIPPGFPMPNTPPGFQFQPRPPYPGPFPGIGPGPGPIPPSQIPPRPFGGQRPSPPPMGLPPQWRPGMTPAPVTHAMYAPLSSMRPPVHRMDFTQPLGYPTPSPTLSRSQGSMFSPSNEGNYSDAIVPSGGPNIYRSPAWKQPLPLSMLHRDDDLIDIDEDMQKGRLGISQLSAQSQPSGQLPFLPQKDQLYSRPHESPKVTTSGHIISVQPGPNSGGFESRLPKTFQSFPVALQCPHCSQKILTKPVSKISALAVALAVLLFFTTVIFFFLPLISPRLRNIQHQCPKCSGYIGTKKHECCGDD